MDYQHNDQQTNVPNNAEQSRNHSEREQNRFEPIPNESERVPHKPSVRSELVLNENEERTEDGKLPLRDVPNSAESLPNSLGSVPNNTVNRSEHVQNDSEQARNTRPEQFRTAPSCSEEHDEFTITVREAARIFEEAGVPRTERAITKWCNKNARGITRLDCCYSEAERKYYITPQSIERVSVEERKKFQYMEYQNGGVLSAKAEDLSEHIRKENTAGQEEREFRNGAEHEQHEKENRTERMDNKEKDEQVESDQDRSSTGSAERLSEDESKSLKELKLENFELRVQLEGQKYLIRQFDELVSGERDRHEKEKMALVDRLTDARRQVGTLEQKLLQLEAPNKSVRDAETEEHREVNYTAELERRDVR